MKTQAQSNRESKWRGIGSASSIGIFAEQAFWRAAEARLIPGNSARVLKDAAENYPAWLEAIESAQHTIHFESYVIHGRNSEDDQAHFIASGLGFNYCMGHNRELKGGVYGNLALSRFPLLGSENHDISVAGREERGCLRVDVSPGKESRLHVYNVHLGASFIQRRRQARKLISESILSDCKIPGPRIMPGDFNEWSRGPVTRLMNEHFRSGDIRMHLKRSRTYPGLLPLMHLDHIYFDETLE